MCWCSNAQANPSIAFSRKHWILINPPPINSMFDWYHHTFWVPSVSSFTAPALPAFSKETLLDPRWYLGSSRKGVTGYWYDLLKMDHAAQHVFLQRILFMFEILKRKAGRCQSLKIPLATWQFEADLTCLVCHVLEEMRNHRTPDNQLVFTDSVLVSVMKGFIDGIFGLNDIPKEVERTFVYEG